MKTPQMVMVIIIKHFLRLLKQYPQQIRGNESMSRGYKNFFVFNSAEHEILNAHKYKTIKEFSFLGLDQHKMLFFLS